MTYLEVHLESRCAIQPAVLVTAPQYSVSNAITLLIAQGVLVDTGVSGAACAAVTTVIMRIS